MKRFAPFILFLLAGCSFMQPRDVGYGNMLTLQSLGGPGGAQPPAGVLKLAYPSAAPDLDTYRIAVRRADGRVDYIDGARWNDFLPEIMSGALQETLKNGGTFSYVEQEDGQMEDTHVLHTQINRFTVVYKAQDRPPAADVSMTFGLQCADGAGLSHFTLAHKAAAKENTMAAIGKAFDAAFTALERELVAKVAAAGECAKPAEDKPAGKPADTAG